jgi:PAS domain-containing protein
MLAATCGAVVLAIGAIPFAAWMLREQGDAPFPGTIAARTDIAVALALLGSALLLAATVPRARLARWLARICCAIVVALGLATLSWHVFGWELGIDELLHREPAGGRATTEPDPMGPPAAILLPLLGTALLLLQSVHARRRAKAPYLALIAGAVVTLPILGYAYDVPELYGANATGIAFSSACAFALASVGVLFAGADTPLVRSLSAPDPGGMLLRRLLPATLLLPVVLGWLVVVGQTERSFDPIFGTSILALSFLVVFSLILFRSAAVVSRVASEREQAERDGRELQDRLVHVLENMSQGFFAFGRRRRLGYVNREGERLLGADPGSLADAGLDEVFPAARFGELHRPIETALASATTQHGELRLDRPERWYAYDVGPSAEGVSIFAR